MTGALVGDTDGFLVGVDVVGFAVGDFVIGLRVGLLVGVVVVGACVGKDVVGLAVGLAVGDDVGVDDGSCVAWMRVSYVAEEI